MSDLHRASHAIADRLRQGATRGDRHSRDLHVGLEWVGIDRPVTPADIATLDVALGVLGRR
jgi:hypothetical protein